MSAREHVQAMIQRGLAMFDLEQFIADCRAARAADRSSKTICEVVRRAVSNPTGLLKALGEPDNANIKELLKEKEKLDALPGSDKKGAAKYDKHAKELNRKIADYQKRQEAFQKEAEEVEKALKNPKGSED